MNQYSAPLKAACEGQERELTASMCVFCILACMSEDWKNNKVVNL